MLEISDSTQVQTRKITRECWWWRRCGVLSGRRDMEVEPLVSTFPFCGLSVCLSRSCIVLSNGRRYRHNFFCIR